MIKNFLNGLYIDTEDPTDPARDEKYRVYLNPETVLAVCDTREEAERFRAICESLDCQGIVEIYSAMKEKLTQIKVPVRTGGRR